MDTWRRWLVPPALVLSTPGLSHAERYLSVDAAQAAMFPGERLSPEPLKLTSEQARAIEKTSGVRVRVPEVKVWRAEKGGVFIVDEVLGKHDYITWALALNADGTVKQVEILEYRETYGSEVRNEKWRAQFRGRRSGDRLRLDEDIRNISGATLSCRHVTDGVKRLLATYEIALKR
jgi:Na+-translocating ferredoxin:NAD+ oxidoreductase RnfG subunit